MQDSSAVQVLLSPEEFAADLERLGRANGNILHRKPGIEGLHDGQYMVRLKKKRFIIIDYSIIPNEADMQTAVLNSHMHIPDGAGTQKCANADCTKVGVPVLLYDSNPGETPSLYLRAGLCFTCQRNLNEQRRTQRKRKKDIVAEQMAQGKHSPYASSAKKKGKMSVEMAMGLSPEAIINGVEVAKQDGEQGYPEIGPEIQSSLLEAAAASQRLVAAVTKADSEQDPIAAAFDAAVAASGSAADAGIAAYCATSDDEDIVALYEKAFSSMSRGMYLLSQWKASWDNAVSAAAAQETVANAGLADAVASAAAVAALKEEGKKDEGEGVFSV